MCFCTPSSEHMVISVSVLGCEPHLTSEMYFVLILHAEMCYHFFALKLKLLSSCFF